MAPIPGSSVGWTGAGRGRVDAGGKVDAGGRVDAMAAPATTTGPAMATGPARSATRAAAAVRRRIDYCGTIGRVGPRMSSLTGENRLSWKTPK